jgi:hypothetical protein
MYTFEAETQEKIVQQLACHIQKQNLSWLVLPLLEGGQPFLFIGSQCLWVAQPLLQWVVSPAVVAKLAHLLENPQTVLQLAAQLHSSEGQDASAS